MASSRVSNTPLLLGQGHGFQSTEESLPGKDDSSSLSAALVGEVVADQKLQFGLPKTTLTEPLVVLRQLLKYHLVFLSCLLFSVSHLAKGCLCRRLVGRIGVERMLDCFGSSSFFKKGYLTDKRIYRML